MFILSRPAKTPRATHVLVGDVQSIPKGGIEWWTRQTIGLRRADYIDAHVDVRLDLSQDRIMMTADVTFWTD